MNVAAKFELVKNAKIKFPRYRVPGPVTPPHRRQGL